jgi:lysophospholipase L1-like esterase
VRFVGRMDQSETDVTKFAWSGSGVLFRFEGTDASVSLDDSAQFFTVVVDGTTSVLATTKGKQTYPLATGLPAGTHEVRLYRRTEASFGTTKFYGVDLGAGTLLPPPPAAPRRIEVIGDSITCGYGNEGANENCNFSADTENHYLTYAAITARDLNADLVTIAWSGKGIVYNYGDDKTDPLPALYDRVLPYDAGSQWGFSWQPDVVVINLGSNDFSTDGDPSQSLFGSEYEKFLSHLRDKYPSASIVALVPTLLGGNDLTQAKNAIETAVGARSSAGDSKVEAFSMSFQQSGWGCDYHPSLATHASMAQELTTKLKSLKGW